MAETLGFWFRKKYNLTPNDPRYLDMTAREIEVDFWAHHFYDNPSAKEEVEDEDFDLEAIRAAGDADDDQWETLVNMHGE